MKFIYVSILSLLLLNACQEQVIEVKDQGYVLTSDSMAFHLEKQFDRWTILMCQDELNYMDTLQSIYKNRDYRPFWWDELNGDSASWANLRKDFSHSVYHGMDSLYYHLGLVDYYKSKIHNFSVADSAYRYLVELELILSNKMLDLYSDVGNGRTNPKSVYGYTYMLPRNNVKTLDYEAFLKSDNRIEILDNIHRGDTTYEKLQEVMEVYIKRQKAEQKSAIDFSDYPKLEVGDTAEVIPLIIKKLQAKNLPNNKIHTINADTLIFTKELKTIIQDLQSLYQLTPDGIMGFKTYKIINTDPSDKIDQIKANLERQRWFNKPIEKPYAYINLPKYEIEMHWEDSTKQMKVCIGKNLPDNYDDLVKEYTDSGWLYKLPRNMETPQIASKISYMVVNPTWTVPYSIIKREMWWRMIADPEYLKSKGFKVYKGKKEVPSETIDWSKVDRDNIPYRIVEDPGPKNSLGTVKYMFNNPFSIYLHDTPNKSAFRRTQRAVSHGCVRLENPVLFGEFLMQNSRKYDADDFRIMMGYPPKDPIRLEEYDVTDSLAAVQKLDSTTSIYLDSRMPLFLDYRTVYFDKEWQVRFCYDIYNQNRLILQAMNE